MKCTNQLALICFKEECGISNTPSCNHLSKGTEVMDAVLASHFIKTRQSVSVIKMSGCICIMKDSKEDPVLAS